MKRMTTVWMALSGLMLFSGVVPRELPAVPAAPDEHELGTSEGAAFQAHRWGDENIAGWETRDGFTILFDKRVNDWSYADHDATGRLVSSRHRLADGKPPAHLQKRLRPVGKGKEGRRIRATSRELSAALSGSSAVSGAAPATSISSAAVTGTGYVPVLLVNFTDTTPTYSVSNFTSLLFGSGTWSMSDYYREVSYGKFTVSAGPAGVRGWFTAGHSHDYYGQNDASGNDPWPGDLVYETVKAADATVDFSAYDQDGDCKVDVVAIVHQGTGEEASPKDSDIWSHRWSLSDAKYFGNSHYGAYTTNDRCAADPSRFVKVDDYIMQPEKYSSGITTVGVFVHEYGHVLGLPDLYDTDYSSEGIGVWSVMAAGEWNGLAKNGDRPGHPDAWCKSRLGWVAPQRLTTSAYGKTLGAASSGADVLQVRYGSAEVATGEYFLLENRQLSGFDAALPGSGLLVWHVDESKEANADEWYPGLPDWQSHYKVALLQADNLFQLEKNQGDGDSWDPFPGGSNKRFLGTDTIPDNNLYGGLSSGFSLNNISNSAATMTLDVVMTDTVAPVTTITAAPAAFSTSRSGSFTFSASESALFDCRLDSATYAPCTSPYDVASLADGEHSFSVRATDLIGNVEGVPPTHSWTIDTVPPDTAITAKPPALAGSGYGSFSFISTEAATVFECTMDGGVWQGCVSPYAFYALANGGHTFSVRAVDRAGNVDTSAASHTWSVAVTAPEYAKLTVPGWPDSYFPSLVGAQAAIPAGNAASVRLRNVEFAEDVVFSADATALVSGGYDATFSGTRTNTRLHGSLTVAKGVLTADSLILY